MVSEPVGLIRKIRIWLALFMVGLVLSGITAFPLERETAMLNQMFGVADAPPAGGESNLHVWLRRVHEGIVHTNRDYPFMAYGTDWLAFGHLVIAVVFLGPLVDPVRNKWVLVFGVIACAGVLPLALIAGSHPRNSFLLAAHRLQLRRHRRRALADLPALRSPDRRNHLIALPVRLRSLQLNGAMATESKVPEITAAIVDTIAAISTPPGRGGIGIVRLSGPQSASIAAQLVRLRQPLEHARARLAEVLDENDSTEKEQIDEASGHLFRRAQFLYWR